MIRHKADCNSGQQNKTVLHKIQHSPPIHLCPEMANGPYIRYAASAPVHIIDTHIKERVRQICKPASRLKHPHPEIIIFK